MRYQVYSVSFVIGENFRLGRAVWGCDYDGHIIPAELRKLINTLENNGAVSAPKSVFINATYNQCPIVSMQISSHSVTIQYVKEW